MWEKIYVWIESYAGCSYDVDEAISYINNNDNPFVNTVEWKLVNEQLVDQLEEIFDIITDNATLIPDDLPDSNDMKKMFAGKILMGMLSGLNNVKRQLHIQQIDINDYNVLLHHIDVMFDLICMMKENSLDEIIDKSMFDKYNEENEDMFTDLFGLTSSDVSNIYYTISAITEQDDVELDDAYDASDEI